MKLLVEWIPRAIYIILSNLESGVNYTISITAMSNQLTIAMVGPVSPSMLVKFHIEQ